MSFLSNYGLFLLQVFTLVAAILVTFGGIIAIAAKGKGNGRDRINTEILNEQLEKQQQDLLEQTLDKKAFKAYKKAQKQAEKETKDEPCPRVFVLNFVGDIKASAVESLRKEITAILGIVNSQDEVVVNIESGGGTVNNYGLGASQLQRIVDHQIPLTVCVDKIAASGGYLMASVADKVLAAPFAIIGSIGVVAQLPNFHRWLKKHDIDFELLTAGEYKRTLTMFGENTDKAREKFHEDLDNVHSIFKDHISKHRNQATIDEVATGEHWLAQEAFELKLIDRLVTSDEYLLEKTKTHQVITIEHHKKPSVVEKLIKPAAQILNYHPL